MMQRAQKWLQIACLCILGLLISHVAKAAISVVVTGGKEVTIHLNEVCTATFNASVSGAPKPAAECTINGPSWSWSGGSPGTLSSNGAAATLTFSYSQPGDYTLSVSASATYTDTKKGVVCDGPFSGSGSNTETVHVLGGPITGTQNLKFFCISGQYIGSADAMAGQPAGTTYSWSLTGKAQFCDAQGQPVSNPTTSHVSYQGVSPGSSAEGDVTLSVTYSAHGSSVNSDDLPITVHCPTTFTSASKTPPVVYGASDPNAYGFTGQTLTFTITDGLGQPVTDTSWNEIWTDKVPSNLTWPTEQGGPLDANGQSVDNFALWGWPAPSDNVQTATHKYYVGGSHNGTGCLLQTYTGVKYTTTGLVGNGF